MVLNEACRRLQLWRNEIPAAVDLRININVSSKQVTSPDFLAVLDHALAGSGLRPDRVNMELTESVLMENAERARLTLTEIRRRGVRIHLDDFGTGYSSLSCPRNFPVDSLKIDRSFVSAAGEKATSGHANEEIVRTIIGLANNLSLTATAERTESLFEVEALRDLGCTNVQSYHFSPPVASGTAAEIIAGHQCVCRSGAGRGRCRVKDLKRTICPASRILRSLASVMTARRTVEYGLTRRKGFTDGRL